jgi:2Fe-2S ferredoxin
MQRSSSKPMPLVTFLPSARSVDVGVGDSLLSAARRASLPIASSCRGIGICDACRVQVLTGSGELSPATSHELGARLAPDERLACQARVNGPVKVTASYW